jgi:hypothetical protein
MPTFAKVRAGSSLLWFISANRNAREWSRALRLSLYFQYSELDGAKWQISLKKFLSQFQIETELDAGVNRAETGYLSLFTAQRTDFRLFALLRRGLRPDWIW